MAEFSLLQKIAIWALPVIFAITVHEVAHGYIAKKLGDRTAEQLGRLTLNPIKHIDPVGTIVVPLILLSLTSFVFGWAKPVPVNWNNLKRPQRDMALVAIAGPASNLLMAIGWALLLKFCLLFRAQPATGLLVLLIYMSQAGVLINLVLMVLNSLPIPPLDGSRVLSAFLSPRLAAQLAQIEIYGFVILVILLISGVLGKIIGPVILGLFQLLVGFAGL